MALKLLFLLLTITSLGFGGEGMAVTLKDRRGFTLIELMIVVAIISVLASMAIPEYYNFMCKARQSEAKESLGMIAKCQEAYFLEYDTYSTNKNKIGFFMRGTPYYSYEIISADQTSFNAKAIAYYKERLDEWVIDDMLNLNNQTNACRGN